MFFSSLVLWILYCTQKSQNPYCKYEAFRKSSFYFLLVKNLSSVCLCFYLQSHPKQALLQPGSFRCFKAAAHKYNEWSRERSNGVKRRGGSTSGPRPGIHLPAISLRKLPFKALRGWSLEDMPIDKAGSSIAPVIQRPSPCASWSSDKDGWGCRAIPASQIAHRNDADGALVKEDRNSLCLTQVRFTYPVLHMDPLPGWK